MPNRSAERVRHWILPVLIVLLMGTIFWLSAQPAGESTQTSSGFCRAAARVIFTGYDRCDTTAQAQMAEGLTVIVRKTAHFCEYALLGLLWYLWLCRRRHGALLSAAAGIAYACTDELHQLLVPGRAGMWQDVVLDSAGVVCGIAAAFVLLCVVRCCRDRHIVEWGVWK